MRLDKFLTNTYIASRKDAKKIIKNKQITINDICITKEDYNVDILKDIVKINDNIIHYQEKYYFILNKPKGYVSSTSDSINKTVMELFKDLPKMLVDTLFPIGRLDLDTEGLLIITNDGDFSHYITSPKNNISKKYYIEYEGKLSENSEELLRNQLILDDGTKCLPALLERIDDKSCYITIYEGKYHQVKKMTHQLGVCLTYLKRVSIGTLSLDKRIIPGSYIEIKESEIKKHFY